MTKSKRAIVSYTDGAARGNPGPAGIGIALYLTNASGSEEVQIEEHGYIIGKHTNNIAEYMAMLFAVWYAEQAYHDYPLVLKADSELLVKQITGIYKVKNERLKALYVPLKKLLDNRKHPYHIYHVRREKNKEADKCANHGVDTKTPLPENFLSFLSQNNISWL